MIFLLNDWTGASLTYKIDTAEDYAALVAQYKEDNTFPALAAFIEGDKSKAQLLVAAFMPYCVCPDKVKWVFEGDDFIFNTFARLMANETCEHIMKHNRVI